MHAQTVRRLALACAAAAALVPGAATAADAIFLTIAGVQGESTSLQGAIDVLAVSTGVSARSGAGAGGGPGRFEPHRAAFSDMTVMVQASAASPLLEQAAADGHVYSTAVITFYKASGDRLEPYLTYTLSNVLVTEYQVSGSSGGGRPTESVGLSYARIKTEYRPQRRDGSFGDAVVACWDLHQNRSCR